MKKQAIAEIGRSHSPHSAAVSLSLAETLRGLSHYWKGFEEIKDLAR